MEQEFPINVELLSDNEVNVAAIVDELVKYFAGRPMLIIPPMGRFELVVKETNRNGMATKSNVLKNRYRIFAGSPFCCFF